MNHVVSPLERKASADRRRAATCCARSGLDSDLQHGAVVPPLHLSSTYSFAGYAKPRRYDYGRSGNPTRDQLGAALAELEQGHTGIITASGMAAVTLVCQLLEAGQGLLAPHDCYGGTHRLFTHLDRRGLLKVDFVDQSDRAAMAKALHKAPSLVWVETPSNPLLRVVDIAAISDAAHAAGARVAVDNTFLSPHWQRPLTLGADIVVHSTTKYINGHSDVVGGAVIAGESALAETLAWWANCLGLTAAPFDCFLTLRGLRTLPARLRVHQDNALNLARLLAAHPAVREVHYPGLAHHPQQDLIRSQQSGSGAMLSFELDGGVDAVRAFLAGLRCFSLAESLGGVESLVAHPATMTHAAMDPAARRRAGITDGLLRLSVGIEAIEDLSADVLAALERARTIATSCATSPPLEDGPRGTPHATR